MTRTFRILYAAFAWLFLIGLAGQVFLMGLYLFDDSAPALDAHRDVGWILHLAPLLVLLFAYLARAGRAHWQWALALTVVVLIVPILPALRDASPIAAALHPVGAAAGFALAAVVAWNSVRAVRAGDAILVRS